MYLVSCVSTKKSRPCPARELYCSDWFLKARAYVEAQGAEWFVLSAKHGLVAPDTVVAPYSARLTAMPASLRKEWAQRVVAALRPRCRSGSDVVFLAGAAYREHLVPTLNGWGCNVNTPMKGLGIGQQKRWLKRALQRTASLRSK
jgi:hypothetical protein